MPRDAIVVQSDTTLAEMDADAAFAAEVRWVSAALRQAVAALQNGSHETFEEAMEAICGFRTVMVEGDHIGALHNWDEVTIRQDVRRCG